MNTSRSLLVIVAGLLLASSKFGTAQQREIDLFIFAGQSNMVGADADPSAVPIDESDGRVMFWWSVGDPPADRHDSTSGGKWTTLQTQPLGNPRPRDGKARQWGNFTSPDGGFGPEIGFARQRLSLTMIDGEDPAFAILKVAYSGTSVENDWDPRQSHRPGNCYGELIRQFEAARRAASSSGMTLRPAGLFWVQGESDSSEGRRDWYANRLTQMIAAAREDLGVVSLPVLMAVNTRFQEPDNPGMSTIVDAQKQIADRDPSCVYVDTSDATVANRVHFDAAGTLSVGRMFAQAYDALRPAANR